jgi:hypothetical protein
VTKIQIELPEATAKAASDAGLLTSQVLDRLLTDAIRRRQNGQKLLDVVSRIHASDVAPMSGEEIDAEVKAVRANLRQRSAMTAGGSADRS